MKFISTFFVLLAFAIISNAQPVVYLTTGKIINTDIDKNPSNNPAFFSDNLYKGNYFLWLQFSKVPADDVRKNIEETGVKLLEYLPDNTFISAFPSNYNFNQLKQFQDFVAIGKPRAAYKIDNNLYLQKNIPWAIDGNKIKVEIAFTEFISKSSFINTLKEINSSINLLFNTSEKFVSASLTMNEIQEIAKNPLVIFIEPTGAPGRVEDIAALTNHRVTSVQTGDNWVGGKKLDGSGINVVVGDDGEIGPHIDFEGRILQNGGGVGTHGDHVSGIVLGAGNLNPLVRGQAPNANLLAYDGFSDYNALPGLYSTDLVRISTHSLGQGCSSSNYTSNAIISDQNARLYPQLIYTHSSGNSGQDPQSQCSSILGNGYRTITGGYKAGKNVVTVGNLTKSDVISASSSRGPVSDGRIKPDIAAVGESVNSTQPNNSFAVFSGTSMACPAIAGDLALLYQAWREKNNSTSYPEAALMKAVLLSGADDLGYEGPDYTYGFGRVNVRKSVKIIDETRYLSSSITTNTTNNHTITIPSNVAKAKILVYWADWEATAGSAKNLINNIDAKIISSSNVETLPWTMDISTGINVNTVDALAIRYQDSLNNVEQIQLDNPTAGNYTLRVFGKAIPRGPQKYFVVYEFDLIDDIVVTYPIGGESLAPSDVITVRWDATAGTDNFKVEYSINNGTNWLTMAGGTSISPDVRQLNWTIPANTAATNRALVRVSRGTKNDVSDTNFVILRVPTNLNMVSTCSTGTTLTWTQVTGATGYDVFRLGNKKMELVGSSATNSLLLLNQDNAVTYYYAIRAKMGATGSNGRLTNAKSFTNTSSNACPMPVKLVSFSASLKPKNVQLKWVTVSEIGMLNYVIERSSTSNFDRTIEVGKIKPNNLSSEQTYTFLDSKIEDNNTYYYRLKMVELGKVYYSSVQMIKISNNNHYTFLISPNPARNNISIENKDNNFKNLAIKIYNDLGVEVLSNYFESININERVNVDIKSLINGNYFIQIIDRDRGNLVSKQQISIIK